MSQKLTLARYLESRGSVKSLTRIEAEAFGVPYPLVSGWPARYGAVEITDVMLEDLAARIATAKRSTADKARLGLEGVAANETAPPGAGRSVAILSAAGVPVHIMSLTRASALDALAFMTALVDEIGLERMAQREGKTFAHFLSGAIGAREVGAIGEYPKTVE